jgi:NTE family protein
LPQTVDNSTGLVISGGGARGAYQIGCWKAFLDRNLIFGAVAGSSIGALNGALVCQGNWDAAYELWLELTRVRVLEFDFRRLVKSAAVGVQDRSLLLTPTPKVRLMKAFEYSSSMLKFASRYVSLRGLSRHGLISIEKFRPLLKLFIDMRNIQQQPMSLFVTVSGTPLYANPLAAPRWFRIQAQTEDDAWKIIVASMSVPLVFSAIDLHGRHYSDGGIGQWLPIEPLYHHGFRRLVIVSTKANTSYNPRRYPGCAFTLIEPRKPLGRFPVATFRFTERAVLRWMQQGYEDATRVLERDASLSTT